VPVQCVAHDSAALSNAMALAPSKTTAMVGHWPDAQILEEGGCNGGSRPRGGRTTTMQSSCLNCCNWQGLSPVLMPLTGLAPASPYFGLRAMGQLSFPQ